MTINRLTRTSLALSFLLTAAAGAEVVVTVAPEEVVNGPAAIDVGGAIVPLPKGWRASGTKNPAVLTMVADDGSTLMVVAKRVTEAQANAELAGRIDLGKGLVLVPTGRVDQSEGLLRADFSVVGAETFMAGKVMTRLNPRGASLSLLALALPSAIGDLDPLMASILEAAELAPPSSIGEQPGQH